MTPETVFVALVGGGVLVVLSAVLLVMTLIGGVQRQTNRRMATIAQRWRHQGAAELPGVRRDSADSSLRSFDRLIKTVLPHPQVLRQRLARTGLKISIGEYVLTSAFVGLLGVLVVVVIVDQGPVLAGCVGLTCAFAVPHIFVWFLTRRRQKKFTSQFPEAIDLIVRGLKSGLPVTESMKVVAKEIQRPVGEEFQLIVDKLAVGTTMEDALWDTAARIDSSSSSLSRSSPKPSSSSSLSRSSVRPVATLPKRWRTCPTCCASASK